MANPELQSEEEIKPEIDSTQIQDGYVFDDEDPIEVGSEPTPDNKQDADAGEGPEKEKDPEPELPDYAKKKIDKKHFELKQAQREKEEAEQKLKEYEERQAANIRPQLKEVPAMPDQFADDFDQQVKNRDAILQHNATVQMQLDAEQQRIKSDYENSIANQQKQFQEKIDGFYKKTDLLGLKKVDVDVNVKKVAAYKPHPQLDSLMTTHEHGPLIFKYLGENPDKLESVMSKSLDLAIHQLYSSIIPEAMKTKLDTPTTPPPANRPGGRGAPEKVSKYMEGVQME